MRLILKKMNITNFKGIKNLEISFEKNTKIFGDNATGKTTIFDAYSWLLWDKDSLNRKSFNIKPFDEDGENLHGIESIVSADFEADGKNIKLSKVYKEIWTKKRGQLKETFSGNTTDYFINDVPVKKLEYNNKISTLVDESQFNLLANPLYFNALIDKKERRNILISLIEKIDKETILEQNSKLKKLNLEEYSIEELKAMAKANLKKINKEIESLPIRIDELYKSKTDYNFSELEIEKKSLEKDIKDIETQLFNSNKQSDLIREYSNQIKALEEEKRNIKNEIDKKTDEIDRKIKDDFYKEKEKIESKKRKVENKLSDLSFEMKRIEKNILDYKKRIEQLDESIENSRNNWIEENSKQFNESLICPICERQFEENRKNELIANFNKNKSEKLGYIEKVVKKIKEEKAETEQNISELKQKLQKIQKEEEKINEELSTIPTNTLIFEDYKKENIFEEYPTLPKKYEDIENDIKDIKTKIEELGSLDNSELLENRENIKAELSEILEKLSTKKTNKEVDEKIKEYKKREKEFAKMFEEKQETIFLCDEYIRIYTDLIQDKVNNLFEFVNFRLFEKQVNGELKETAEVMVDGVPYSDVNNAGKINAGLDVINTLSKKMNIQVPIFVDNAESINLLRNVDSQIIKLIVSKYKALKVEGVK